jgi:hypothetical protein
VSGKLDSDIGNGGTGSINTMDPDHASNYLTDGGNTYTPPSDHRPQAFVDQGDLGAITGILQTLQATVDTLSQKIAKIDNAAPQQSQSQPPTTPSAFQVDGRRLAMSNGFPVTPTQSLRTQQSPAAEGGDEGYGVTFRHPVHKSHTNTDHDTVQSPSGKLIPKTIITDLVTQARKFKDCKDFKYVEGTNFNAHLKLMHDHLFERGISYVLNLGKRPYDIEAQAQAFEDADTRMVAILWGKPVYYMDQVRVYTFFAGSFGHIHRDIFATIKISTEDCGTRAFEEVSQRLLPKNTMVALSMKRKLEAMILMPLSPGTTLDARYKAILQQRCDLNSQGEDVSAYEIMTSTMQALQHSP